MNSEGGKMNNGPWMLRPRNCFPVKIEIVGANSAFIHSTWYMKQEARKNSVPGTVVKKGKRPA